MVNNRVPAEAVILVAIDQKLYKIITEEQIIFDNILLWRKCHPFCCFNTNFR